MMPFTSQQLAEQFSQLLPEKRIIFLQPNFNGQHLALEPILRDAVYVCFHGQDLDAEQLRSQLSAALEAQSVKRLDSKVPYLVLDEADRATAAAFARFLTAVSAELDGGRVIVLSRVLPNGVLDDAQIKSQATFFPTDPNVMLWDYAQNDDETLLEVRAFGEGRVHVNGRAVDNWDGALPRALFFYLVDKGMVTRAEIFQTFWSGLNTREATNVFHVTKRKISEVLGTELTLYGSGFYHISPKIQLSYDVSLFNQLVQDSDSSDGSDHNMLRQAISLYRGDYLMSLKADWIVERRDSLQQSVCDAMIALGKIYEGRGENSEALGCYLRAAHLRPEREDAAYSIMRLYSELSLPQDAMSAYHRLSSTLKRKLKVEPSSHIQKLAAQLGR
jgi:DNA-binding SARP family transcriptional activator